MNIEQMLNELINNPLSLKVIGIFITLLVLYFIVRVIKHTISKKISDSSTRYRARKIAGFLGFVIGILIIGFSFSGSIKDMAVGLGIAGAGVAFAFKEFVESIAGWFMITFGNFYRTGDRIQIGKIKGDVIDIGILQTTLMEIGEWVSGDLYSGRIIRIANNQVFKEDVFNYSSDFPFVWDQIVMPVKYGTDYELAANLFIETINNSIGNYVKEASAHWETMKKKFLVEHAKVEPSVTIKATDNWVELNARYVVDYMKRGTTKHSIYLQLLKKFDEHKIQIASATFELSGLPAINLKLSS